ncbi:MAG: nitrite/sulfite reductase [Candidatus Thioglobus autotrophicus]|jgi:sulfite reductase (NADPH) hemoprotein beta-component|nr:nitrite/sulfite reductase [Candidatus Thioglobus autotrophicus]
MYQYSPEDTKFLVERVDQFEKQLKRHLDGDLDAAKFRSLRLRNGLYMELHAHMLRVAIPYGTLNTIQLRALADVADKYDRGFGHFTTRQNIQYNWIELSEIANLLRELSSVGLHAIQTSGKATRNITADPLSGLTEGEIADARPYCELIRRWLNLHPEFSWLPGKFKIAINGAKLDETALRVHDLGLRLIRNKEGELGFTVYVGGGLGAAAMVAAETASFVPVEDILSYLESAMRIYNLKGRRDHLKKLRIKFLVRELGAKEYSRLVDEDWKQTRDDPELKLNLTHLSELEKDFALPIKPLALDGFVDKVDFNYSIWKKNNVRAHKVSGHSIVNISLTKLGEAPGDATSEQMRILADLADQYSYSELRTTKRQTIVFPYVRKDQVFDLWQSLEKYGLASPHQGTLAQIVACPGGDYCDLAKAGSIPIATRVQQRFDDMDKLLDIGDLNINISGCENSCAHHHVADIGLLGMQKNGEEYYQITVAGETLHKTVIGKKLGPSVSGDNVVDAVEDIVNVYLDNREEEEKFTEVFKRIGIKPFKEKVYE